jgi:ribosome-associated protein
MTSEATAKKDIQKLQRAIVDGLEDVKAQDIQVFNTEALSPLFERVIIATGTSNRQTKALASSVRDAVREAGFPKPRLEGEEVGEWIIVDCGQAVAHIMQPAIRQYYHLEDLWGEKPVRLKLGAAKPAPRPAQPQAGPAAPTSLKRSSAAQKGVAALPARAQEKPAAAKKAASKSVAKSTAAKTASQAAVGKASSRRPLKVVKVNVPKPAAKKAAAKATAKKAPARKSASRKG